mgnify:CR=1 FL=1
MVITTIRNVLVCLGLLAITYPSMIALIALLYPSDILNGYPVIKGEPEWLLDSGLAVLLFILGAVSRYVLITRKPLIWAACLGVACIPVPTRSAGETLLHFLIPPLLSIAGSFVLSYRGRPGPCRAAGQ